MSGNRPRITLREHIKAEYQAKRGLSYMNSVRAMAADLKVRPYDIVIRERTGAYFVENGVIVFDKLTWADFGAKLRR